MIWHSTDREQFIKYMNTNTQIGLTGEQADAILKDTDENIVLNKTQKFISVFAKQLKTFPNILLAIAVIILIIVAFSFHTISFVEPLLIAVIALLKVFIDSAVIFHTQNTINKPYKMSYPTCKVIRNGETTLISANNLVVGDILSVDAGDYIVADARLIESVNLHCDESALTGEPIEREKDATALIDEIAPLSERINMLYAGCHITSGHGLAIVTETGNNTEKAKTFLINCKNDSIDPLNDKLASFHKVFKNIIWAVCALIFILGVLFNLHSSETTFTDLISQKFAEIIALAFTVIPDGLLAFVTIALSFGIQRMLKKNAVVKSTRCLKALGDIDIICSDKTGTLTTNIMTVTAAFNGEKIIELSDLNDAIDVHTSNTLRLASLCTDIESGNDPTQTAINEACAQYLNLPKTDLEALYPRIAEIPFDAQRKLMTTVNMIDGTNYCIVKGAPHELISLCPNCNKDAIIKAAEQMSAEALRVIAVGIKALEEAPSNPTSDELENNLTFVGLLGLSDKLRADAVSSIQLCKASGIKTVMITGDNIITASSIAKKLGILSNNDIAITGEQLNALSDDELLQKIESISVYASVSPDDKLRIIKAWQALEKTVAITGDSVADAAALRSADIGFAMGNKGTDVAKGSADVILTDDSFSTIPETAKEARSIFRNLRNTVRYLLTCNISKIILCLFGLVIFGSFPFTALQLLWLCLTTNIVTTISICSDSPSDKILNSPSKNNIYTLFDKAFALNTGWQSAIIAITALVALGIGGGIAAYTTLAFAHILHIFNVRTKTSVFTASYKNINFIAVSVIVSLLLVILTVFTPIASIFGFVQIKAGMLLLCVALGFIPTVCCEIVKLYSFITKK